MNVKNRILFCEEDLKIDFAALLNLFCFVVKKRMEETNLGLCFLWSGQTCILYIPNHKGRQQQNYLIFANNFYFEYD